MAHRSDTVSWYDPAEHRARYLAWLAFYRAHPEKAPRLNRRTGLIRDITHSPSPRRPYPPRA